MNGPSDISGESSRVGGQRAERRLKARLIFLLFRRRAGRLLVSLFVLVLLFAGIAAIQHWFVQAQLYRTTKQELGLWAVEVAREVAYKDKWDLAGYRRASIAAPNWNVLTREGLVIDIEGFTPGLFGRAQLPDESIFGGPQTVVTAVGERWRIFGKKVVGGVVVLGYCTPDNLLAADAKLVASAAKFGRTLENAAATRSREVDFEVDYAVLSSDGEIKAAWGGVPLKTDPRSFALASPSEHLARLLVSGRPFLVYYESIRGSAGQEVGAVILPKDVSLEEQALRAQDRFNYWVVGVAGVLAFGVLLLLVAQEFVGQARRVPLEEALKIGESRRVEFKGSFLWDIHRNEYVEERRLDVLKSIAGFLNTSGGTLFIGVSEEGNPPEVRGLDEDLNYVGGSRDKLQRLLRDLITTRIGSQFSPLIAESFGEMSGRLYWEVVVEASPEPAFVRWKSPGERREQTKFYVREGPKTSDLDNESTWHYIKNWWGK